jgi:hypothetical protein
MKKTLTILSAIITTIISLNAKAQDKDPGEPQQYTKSYITLLGGVSTPLGNFASYNYYNNKAGFAKRGVVLGLDGADYLYKNLAFAASLTFQDQGQLSYNDALNLATGFTAQLNKDNTTITTVGRYHSIMLLGGPQYSFTYKKFVLDLRAQAGAIKSTSTPTVSAVFDNLTSIQDGYNQLSSSALVFAYGGSAGLRWSFADGWDIGVKGNYVYSSGLPIINTNNPNTGGRFVTRQPITVFQTTFGITVRL